MTTHRSYQPHNVAPRVLLLGPGWEMIQGALAAASDTGAIEVIGTDCDYDADFDCGFDSPAVLLLSPHADLPAQPRDHNGPLVLRCVADDDLDSPDLYADSDDFVAIPCAPAELVKRILRLAQRRAVESGSVESDSAVSIRVGGISLNPATYQVSANGRPVDLAWLEFQLLHFLMDNVGRVFTRDQLLANVWGVENIGGTRTVDVHIRRLRYKLENGPETYFRTVKNVGYGMIEP